VHLNWIIKVFPGVFLTFRSTNHGTFKSRLIDSLNIINVCYNFKPVWRNIVKYTINYVLSCVSLWMSFCWKLLDCFDTCFLLRWEEFPVEWEMVCQSLLNRSVLQHRRIFLKKWKYLLRSIASAGLKNDQS